MEYLYINGKIFTSDPSLPWAEAMLIAGGRVKWIGSMKDIPKTEDRYETIDLGGHTVLPGFVDAHMHPIMLADYSTMISALPPAVCSIAELTEKVREVRKGLSEPECKLASKGKYWIRGWGYDEGKFSERRAPNRYDLDRGASDVPVLIHRTCAHVICVNSKALEIAGIDASTPDPEGGQIERDENGIPTGVLRENAKNLVEPFLPVPSHDELVQQIVSLGEILAKQGIVAVADMGLFDSTDTYSYFIDAAKAGFKQRVAVYYMWQYFYKNPPVVTPEMCDHNNQVFVAGTKTVGDGSISGRTAWVYEPYLGGDDCGIQVCSDEVLESAISFAKEHGIQLSMHAMGGRAIDRIIDRMASEQCWTGSALGSGHESALGSGSDSASGSGSDSASGSGHESALGSGSDSASGSGFWPHLRLEHLTEPTDHAMAEAVKNGYAFVTQPIFAYSEIESYLKNFGLERTAKAYPIRTMLEKGVNVVLSTDAPATSWATPSDPLPNIKAAVTRRAYNGVDYSRIADSGSLAETIDIETAIRLYTRAAALVLGMEDSGWLHVGARADFLVLSDDIFTIDPEKIDTIKITTHMGQ